jgi:hypothetical protein
MILQGISTFLMKPPSFRFNDTKIYNTIVTRRKYLYTKTYKTPKNQLHIHLFCATQTNTDEYQYFEYNNKYRKIK